MRSIAVNMDYRKRGMRITMKSGGAVLNGLLLTLLFWHRAPAQTPSCDYNNRSVLFGERAPNTGGDVYRICIDREGYFYPDTLILDAELQNSCSSLRQWYKDHPVRLQLLCKKYAVPYRAADDSTTNALNDAIAGACVAQINARIAGYEHVNILIHGFRKKLYGRTDATSVHSGEDNRNLAQTIGAQQTKPFFIEIYWDGKFITPLQSYRNKGFALFENAAIPSAMTAGLALRKVVAGIGSPQLNIITHSLGAMVACELLFNASGGKLEGENLLPTPAQQIRAVLIAPAIGHALFERYYARTTTYPYREHDNYGLAILYNRNDFVLLKQYPFGVTSDAVSYGNTALGCDYRSDVSRLTKLFREKYPASAPPLLLDCSLTASGRAMGCHLVRCYSGHERFVEAVGFLY